MALSIRFMAIDKAILVATGNSLVVCGDTTTINANTSDMITTINGKTRDWTQAGSTAKINILNNSTILYAELIWYSTVKNSDPTALDVRSIADNPINLTTPQNGNILITPQNTESYTGTSGTIDRFRSANVTEIIKNSLGGSYTVANVPTSIPPVGLSNTRAGWTLVVIYRNDTFKPKKIVFYSGIESANENKPIQTILTGFSTEGDEASLKGNLFLACANAEPLAGVQILKAGPSFAKLTTIGNPVGTPNPNPGTIPNNPWNWFFTGQINICDSLNPNEGLLDISGTNGLKNHDAFVPTQVLGARNKWDITMIDISNTLVPNQTQLAGECTASGTIDGIEIVAVGTEVNSLAPDITAVLTCYESGGKDESDIEVGEELVYLVQVNNKGKGAANNLIISTTLDSYFSFIPNSVKINGVVQIGADVTRGVNAGTINPEGVTNIVFAVRANSMPEINPVKSFVNYNYEFISGAGSPKYINYAKTNSIMVEVREGKLEILKKVSSLTAIVGDTLTYTIDINNIGSQLAKNILFKDYINQYCSFVKGSVSINGTLDSALDPNVGFNLSDLAPNAKIEVMFDVEVQSLPPSTMIDNGALITFSYMYEGYNIPITKTITSNYTAVQIQYVDVIGNRTNNNNYPNVGDIVTYTLKLTNVGNVIATDVNVQEPTIAGTSFVTDSVTINGVNKPTLNPFTGFTLESIKPQNTTIITYGVKVNELQPGQLVENIAKVPFKYQITPGGPVIETEKDSNKVITRSNFVNITIPETVDKPYATIGDTLYYSINLTNTGNIDALNTIFLAYIQPDTVFVTNSVAINGMYYPGYNPDQGFSIGTLSPNNTVNVTFQAKVLNVPTPNVVYNTSQLIYDYLPDPKGTHITNTAISNTVKTIINKASFTITKSVDKAYVQLGDVILYKTNISNTGTVPLTNVSFSDAVSEYLQFVKGIIYINGIQYPDYDPNNGFNLGNINPNENFEIIFAAKAITAPPFGYVKNISEMTYSYQVNPNTPVITDTICSNEVSTQVVDGNVAITKTASKSYATISDEIIYSFNISNIGNVIVNNVNFADPIPTATSFVVGSVIVNGISKPNFKPIEGFSLGSLNMGQVVSVSFKVSVNSVPTPNTIVNNGLVSFNYHLNPEDTPISKTVTSNNANTIINIGSVALTKSVDKEYATINDTLNYTVVVNNTGTVTLKNVNFTDIIPAGATFALGSVTIDGINKPDFNPNNGFIMDDITAGSIYVVNFKATVTSVEIPPVIVNKASITFKYRINPNGTDINGSQTSNTVTTNVNNATVNNAKSVDKLYATVGDTLTYTSVIANTGNIDIVNTKFTDIDSLNATFVPGSVKIDGESKSNYDPNDGFTLGTIAKNKSVTVTFQVIVKSVPQVGYVTNTSNIYYEYKIDPNGIVFSNNVTSNTVITYINLGSLTVTKDSDRSYARLTDKINYNFVITNTGNTVLKNVFFRDIIQSESSFNSGSVVINGVNKVTYNPNNGFNLENIPIGNDVTISFSVTVNSIPASEKLYNTGSVTFSYYVDPNGSPTIKTVTSNETIVTVKDTIVSATKTVDKANAKVGDTLTFTVSLNNAGNSSAQSVLFEDRLDNHILFDQDSVYINQVNKPGFNPNDGFNLDNILAKTTTIVTFTAKVMSRPNDNIVRNYATINYEYKVDPGQPFIPVTLTTNTTTTYIAIGELTVTKAVNKIYATVSDAISYTINVKNTGSVNTTNMSLKDIVPTATSFKPGTVAINGVNNPDLDPNNGFSIPSLTPNQINVISFDIQVDSVPASGKVENTADITFSYKLTPSDDTVTETITSNKVTTLINLGKLSVTKSVDKDYATIEDALKYTITVKNIGNVNCSSVFFQDIIQSEATFNTGSVIINGESKASLDPNIGFNLNDIAPNISTTILFTVTVKSLPSNYMIYNNSKVMYNYYVDPNNTPVSTNSSSNTVSTQINLGKVKVTKAVSKGYATIGDILTYTVNVSNQGNVNATTVNFRDVIPTGLTFVKNSVNINGISKPGYDPYASFTLGTIIAGDTVIVKFDAAVTSVPVPSLISNIAQITFAYRVNPAGPDIILEVDSNAVTTQINNGELTLAKQVDKAYATIGDILTYTVILTNTGNVDATNVVFTDNLQQEVSFNEGSVIVNGESKLEFDPTVGFSIGTIATLSSVTVSFKVTVNSLPVQEAVLNVASATFSYKIDPNDGILTKATQSNTVSTIIIVGKMTSSKTVQLAYATISDVLNYKIVVKNTGNVKNTNLTFIDTLSSGAEFVNGSVIVDGVSKTSYNPIVGFPLLDIIAGNTATIQFQVKVTSIPTPPQITNYATINGLYRIDPKGPDIQISTTTNTVSTQINVGSISDVKSVDKMYAKVLDTVTYTNVITNVGNVNATNVQFFDTVQAEAMYISGTVRINGVVNPQLNPTVGFSLGDLTPNQKVIVTFDAKINSVPIPPQIDNKSQVEFSYKIDPIASIITKTIFSNTVTTQVVKGYLSINKTVDKPIATVGDTLIYTVNLTNTGNVITNDVFFQDTPSTGATFKAGSVIVNGESKVNFDPTVGFIIGDIGIGNAVTVQFTATVVSVPPINKVTNQAVISFKFVIDPKQPPFNETAYSNITTTNIALGSLNVTKAVDKQFATIGEKLTYTITIINSGNIDATNVIFLDPTPQNSIFVLGSITVNGVSYPDYNPSVGFELNTMKPGEIITVVYQVQVIS